MEAEHAVADYMVGAAASCRDLIFADRDELGRPRPHDRDHALAGRVGPRQRDDRRRLPRDGQLPAVHRGRSVRHAGPPRRRLHPDLLRAASSRSTTPMLQVPVPRHAPRRADADHARLLRHQGQPPQRAGCRSSPTATMHAFQDEWIAPCPLPGLINGDTAFGNCVTSRHFQGFKVVAEGAPRRACSTSCRRSAPTSRRQFGRPGLAFYDAVGFPEDGAVDVAVVGMGPDFGTFEFAAPGLRRRRAASRSRASRCGS